MVLSAMKSLALELGSSCLYGSINSNSSLFRLVHLQRLDLSDNLFNLSQIPSRLGCDLTSLTYINLSHSLFSGQVPSEISKLSKLSSLDLSFNDKFFAEYEIFSTFPDNFVNASSLTSLFLANCGFYGEFPVGVFHLPNLEDQFLQEIGHWGNKFLRSNAYTRRKSSMNLQVLDLANSHLSGMLPQCLGNSSSLKVLNLPNNSFDGDIPQLCPNKNSLRMVDLSYNHLRGKLPRSLARCTQLEFLNLRNNCIRDIFLSWLGELPALKALILGHNEFHGIIGKPATNHEFPNLCIIDLSHNGFSDLSSNKFEEIRAGIIGKLRGLHLLNLSNNTLGGLIPSSLGNLRALESLDLSGNQLLRSNPSNLAQLNFFAYFNISHNHLWGPIQ
ncbi:hypothetical protein FF1_045734 [Malus domestica]